MKIWVTRHGQTDLNAKRLMQGRSDIPLNEKGKSQALATAEKIGNVNFDAVYASTLDRAIETAEIIGKVDRSQIITDERIIEADFGKYEQKPYLGMGIEMNLYWMLPEVFKAPESVETTDEMIKRVRSFFADLEKKDYENVLVTCHGGIIRVIRGYLENAKRGYIWRPKPKNCEIFVYESAGSGYRLVDDIMC